MAWVQVINHIAIGVINADWIFHLSPQHIKTSKLASNTSQTSFPLETAKTDSATLTRFEFPPAGTDKVVTLAWQKALTSVGPDKQLMAHATVLTSINAGNSSHRESAGNGYSSQIQEQSPITLDDWKSFAESWSDFYSKNSQKFPEYAEPLNLMTEFRRNLG